MAAVGALVGVIVTDGVMMRLDAPRLSPIGNRWPGLLGVSVAPPGRDGLWVSDTFGTGVMFNGEPRLLKQWAKEEEGMLLPPYRDARTHKGKASLLDRVGDGFAGGGGG